MKAFLSFIPQPSFVLALALATIPPVSAGAADFAGAEWDYINPKAVLTAAAGITVVQYPNCDSATVDGKSVRDYHADGTGLCQDETFTKVLTEKGKRDNREISIGFMLPYQTVEVTKLEVIKPDGTADPVDIAANSKESIDESQMEQNIYDPNDRILTVNIPQLEVGDMVHVISRQVIHRSIMPDEYDEENVFEGTSYVRHQSYEVHAPTKLPLQRIGLRDEVSGTISSTTQTNGDEVVYHWEITNVPRMFDEPNMPPYDEVLQRLFVSTVPTWEDISRWYWNLSKPHLDMTSPEMKQTVADLTENAATSLDKVKAIFYFVSKKVRYMGLTPEKDRPGFEPHDVNITFEKKYGVCRDKAALLVEMLRLAGFDAYPVLINVGAKRDMGVPQPDFDHAIACVELKKGEYTLMDPTDEHTRDLLPYYDDNRSYLVCRPEGDTLRVSPVQPPENNMLLVKTTGTLGADGALEAVSEFSFEGVNDDAYRNRFAHLKPDEQKRFFEERLKEGMPTVQLTSLKITPENVLDTSVPLRAELKFKATGLTAIGSSKAIVTLPWISGNLGIANRILGGVADLESRKYPLITDATCGVREDVLLKLADGYAAPLAVPDFSPVDPECVAYHTSAVVSNGSLVCSREFKLNNVEFSTNQYLDLKHTLKDIAYDSRKSVILALNSQPIPNTPASTGQADDPVDSNARILYSHKSLDVKDAHTAVYDVKYSKRILTYEGKVREAEVKVSYDPACEEARMVHGVVISETGRRQEISPGEINVMDQGWNGGAQRYTGGKVLVANLPGVDIGSTIEVEYEVSMHDKPAVSGFESFQFPDALDEKSFDLTAPAGLEIHKLISGPAGTVAEQRTSGGGRQTFHWAASRVKALPSEEQLPPDWTYNAGVEYFIGGAADYWKNLNDAMLAHAKNSTNAARLARRLISAARTKPEAVAAIRDFVASNVRNAGPSFTTLPLRELSDADTTLSDGYGHAADRAILTYAMLSAAGLKPEFVMASELTPVPAILSGAGTLPLPDYFEAPLVKVSVDGQAVYLNDTDQYARLGTSGFDDKLGLMLASRKIQTIKSARDCASKTETDYAISLSDNGSARITLSTRYYGTDYNEKRKFFAELPPKERQQYFQEAVSRVAQGARAVGDLQTRFDSYPGVEEFTVDLEDYGVVDGRYLYFNLPFAHPFLSATSDQRSLPYYVAGGREQILHARIDLPAGFAQTEIAPKSEMFTLPGGTQVRIAKSGARTQCLLDDDFKTVPSIISAADYSKIADIRSRLGQKSATTFLLERQ